MNYTTIHVILQNNMKVYLTRTTLCMHARSLWKLSGKAISQCQFILYYIAIHVMLHITEQYQSTPEPGDSLYARKISLCM